MRIPYSLFCSYSPNSLNPCHTHPSHTSIPTKLSLSFISPLIEYNLYFPSSLGSGTCPGVLGHLRESCDISRVTALQDRFLLTQQILNASITLQLAVGFLCLLSQLHTRILSDLHLNGFVHPITRTVNSCIQLRCFVWKILRLLAFTVFSMTLPGWSLSPWRKRILWTFHLGMNTLESIIFCILSTWGSLGDLSHIARKSFPDDGYEMLSKCSY